MTIPSLRRWAFLVTLIVCGAASGVLLVRVALYGATWETASMLSGNLGVLLTLAGVNPIQRSNSKRLGRARQV